MPSGRRLSWRVRFTSMNHNVAHYLRKERVAAALTQADIAALLGIPWKSRIVRYERKGVVPPVRTALAYEAIYRKPLATLLRGTYGPIAAEVRRRAQEMLARNESPHTPRALRRERSLERIADLR